MTKMWRWSEQWQYQWQSMFSWILVWMKISKMTQPRMLRFSPGLTRWQKGGRGREEGQGRWWCFSNEDDFMTWYTVRMLHLWNETMKMIVWHDKPLQVPEDLQKLKKTLSDKTKRKIAENNRKFSICKLCRGDLTSFFFLICAISSKQCRGFRGLVDHMHRDHSDYKPWQCSHCSTKTAFVKTLYRWRLWIVK